MGVPPDPAAPERRLGTVVADKYEILRVLGSGGMGAVYEAHHRFTDRKVALKLLHPNVARGPSAAARFLQEAKTSALVPHRAIVDVLDAGRDTDGALYLAFELLDGEDLNAAVQGGRVTPELAVAVMIEILGALSVAHARGLVHRDIKPPNIFLAKTPDGRTEAKLLDFGVAHRARAHGGDGLTQVGMVLGTLYFMSPEQMSGTPVDPRSDLWAVGVSLFFALTGAVPFESRTYAALLAEIVEKGPIPLREVRADLPDALIRVVDRSLRPSPDERYQSAIDLARALEATVQKNTVPEPSRAKVAEPRRPATWESALADIEGEIAHLRKQKAATPQPPPRSEPSGKKSLGERVKSALLGASKSAGRTDAPDPSTLRTSPQKKR